MKNLRELVVASAVVLLALVAAPARAEFGIGLSIDNNGFGVQAKQQLSPSFDLRFGITGMLWKVKFKYDDIDYDIERSVAIPEIALDWRPMQGKFRFSLAAAYFNDINDLQFVPVAGNSYNIGGGSYTGAQIGTMNGKVSWHSGAPYFGVGWDFLHGSNKNLDFSLDVGAYYRGEPNVKLSTTGGVVSAADLATETQNIKDDAWTFVPTVRLGLTFKF